MAVPASESLLDYMLRVMRRFGDRRRARRRPLDGRKAQAMTPDEVGSIATTAAERAVKSTLLSLGINIETPAAIVEAQLDFQHLRAWRESTEVVKRKVLLTVVTVLVTGAISYLALVFCA